MSRKTGKIGGAKLFIWRGGLGGQRGWSWSTGLALAGRGSGVAGRCPGVRGVWSFGGTRVSSGAGMDELIVQSCHRAGVRRWWWRSNGREGRGGCASRVLGWRGVENGGVSRVMCTERVGGVLAAVVHGRRSGLAWGLSEVQRERCLR
jgi:hypothetical protein